MENARSTIEFYTLKYYQGVNKNMANEQVILGSGDLYIVAFTDTLPADDIIEIEDNKVGHIKGGASLEYKPNEYEVSSDTGEVLKRFVISEEITFKSGVLTWNLETLSKLMANCSYSDDNAGKRTVRIGGKGARKMSEYVVHFVHTEADGNVFKVTLVGTASNGFSLAFAPDKETVVDAEFKAKGHDADGTQVILTEEYDEGVVTPPDEGEGGETPPDGGE